MAKMKLDLSVLRVESFDTAMAESGRGTVHARSGEPEPGDVAFLPVTDWKTCQGADCTARTLCHYTCLGDCYAVVDPVNGAIGG